MSIDLITFTTLNSISHYLRINTDKHVLHTKTCGMESSSSSNSVYYINRFDSFFPFIDNLLLSKNYVYKSRKSSRILGYLKRDSVIIQITGVKDFVFLAIVLNLIDAITAQPAISVCL